LNPWPFGYGILILKKIEKWLTNRFVSGGNALALFDPAEAPLVEKLRAAKIPLAEIRPNPSKTVDADGLIAALVSQHDDLKYLAQKVGGGVILGVGLLSARAAIFSNVVIFNSFR
jgi:hypothetical protein